MFEDFDSWIYKNTKKYLFMLGISITYFYLMTYFWHFNVNLAGGEGIFTLYLNFPLIT